MVFIRVMVLTSFLVFFLCNVVSPCYGAIRCYDVSICYVNVLACVMVLAHVNVLIRFMVLAVNFCYGTACVLVLSVSPFSGVMLLACLGS